MILGECLRDRDDNAFQNWFFFHTNPNSERFLPFHFTNTTFSNLLDLILIRIYKMKVIRWILFWTLIDIIKITSKYTSIYQFPTSNA